MHSMRFNIWGGGHRDQMATPRQSSLISLSSQFAAGQIINKKILYHYQLSLHPASAPVVHVSSL